MRKKWLAVLIQSALVSGVGRVEALWSADTSPEATAAEAAGGPPSGGSSKASKSRWAKDDPGAWKISIYPIYAWAPVMGASVRTPELPSPPGGHPPTGSSSGSTSLSINGLGFAGFEIEKSGWSGAMQVLYGSVSADKENPKVSLSTDIIYGQAAAGRRVWKDFFLEGGARRMALKISATVTDHPEVSRKPGVWDPIIGMTWRHEFGRSWRLHAHLDGGGFGVGTDATIGATVRADWRFSKHFGLTMGMGGLHFQLSDTFLDSTRAARTLNVKQTLYGPLFGFGIYF